MNEPIIKDARTMTPSEYQKFWQTTRDELRDQDAMRSHPGIQPRDKELPNSQSASVSGDVRNLTRQEYRAAKVRALADLRKSGREGQ